MTIRNQNISLGQIKLANDKHVLSVSVDYRKGRGYFLQILCVDGGMYALFGGPQGAYRLLEEASRFNAKKIETWAERFRTEGMENKIYAETVNGVCSANGYVLATSEEDAYKPEEFVVGQRVTIGKDRALIVRVGGVSRFSGRQEYDLILDSNWLWTNRSADDRSEIKSIPDEPILDAQAVALRFKEFQDADAARKAEKQAQDDAKNAEFNKHVADLKAKYPWAKQDGSSHARASANIKRELSDAFPGVQFAVTSNSFSGGDSVNVRWQDGPTVDQVREITRKYQYSYLTQHDMMTDGQSYDSSAFGNAVSTVLGRAKYVSEHRQVTDPAFDDVDKTDYSNRAEQIRWQQRDKGRRMAEDDNAGITVSENPDKGGIELRFSSKPERDVLDRVKANGFRWSKFQKIWYAKANDRTRAFANGLAA